MENKVVIALDAMGGDYAPVETVKGAVEAVNENKGMKVILVGREEEIKSELAKYTYEEASIEIVNATEIIDMGEVPTKAIREKKDSSLVVAMKLVRDGKADAIVSAGSTGAILVGGQLVVGRIKGIKRPALAPFLPSKNGFSLLIDCGANVDARPEHLVQFAQMGSVYFENVMGKKNPTVGIVNIGTEEEKGNQLVKETYPLLRDCKNINFVGSVEARDIPEGDVDVIVTEAFVGNVILKLYEGMGSTLIGMIKAGMMTSLRSKIGALLVKPALKKTLKKFDATEYGGAPMIGLNGLVVKTHGNAKAKEVCNSILQCMTFKEQGINDKIKASIAAEQADVQEN